MKKTLRAKKINEKIKKLYKEFDEIVLELKKSKFKSDDIAFFQDNFKDKDLIFKTTAIKRWELRFK